MTRNLREHYDYLIMQLQQKSIRHEVHEFGSGVKMIDVWYKEFFYVIQVEFDFIGFSEISSEAQGFDTLPDAVFTDFECFRNHMDLIFHDPHS